MTPPGNFSALPSSDHIIMGMMRKIKYPLIGAVLLIALLGALAPATVTNRIGIRASERASKDFHSVSYRSEFLILEWVQKTLSLIRE